MTMQYKWYEIFVEWGVYKAENYATWHVIINHINSGKTSNMYGTKKKITTFDQMKRAIDFYLRNSH